jgi:hypothetical protein
MAGKITVSTINDSSGVLATQNGMTGIAKAWVNYNGVTQTINNSFNVSSVTYNGTGDYTVNFTTAMPNANYAQAINAGVSGATLGLDVGNLGAIPPTTSAFRFCMRNSSSGSAINTTYTSVAIFSS